MSIQDFAASIQSTSLSDALKAQGWIVPALQSIHIVTIAVVFVSIFVVCLRVLGWMRADEPLARVWNRFAPFLWTGLVILAASGTLLTIAEPVREFMTLSFRLKLSLLVIGIVSAAIFGRRIRRAADHEAAAATTGMPSPPGARLAAATTLALWLAIIFLGRAIAYDDSIWRGWSPVESLGGAVL